MSTDRSIWINFISISIFIVSFYYQIGSIEASASPCLWSTFSHQPAHSLPSGGNCASIAHGQKCSIECEEGYLAKGTPYQCVNGQFKGAQYCKSLRVCPLLSLHQTVLSSPHSSLGSCDEIVLEGGRSCSLECSDGYLLSDSIGYRCDGNWPPQLIGTQRCVNTPAHIVSCTVPILSNGTFGADSPAGSQFTEDITLTCDNGYLPNGNTTVKCTDGQIEAPLPTCEVACTVPLVLNGTFDGFYPVNSKFTGNITLTCDAGYLLKGGSVITCTDGQLSAVPVCDIDGAYILPYLVHINKALRDLAEISIKIIEINIAWVENPDWTVTQELIDQLYLLTIPIETVLPTLTTLVPNSDSTSSVYTLNRIKQLKRLHSSSMRSSNQPSTIESVHSNIADSESQSVYQLQSLNSNLNSDDSNSVHLNSNEFVPASLWNTSILIPYFVQTIYSCSKVADRLYRLELMVYVYSNPQRISSALLSSSLYRPSFPLPTLSPTYMYRNIPQPNGMNTAAHTDGDANANINPATETIESTTKPTKSNLANLPVDSNSNFISNSVPSHSHSTVESTFNFHSIQSISDSSSTSQFTLQSTDSASTAQLNNNLIPYLIHLISFTNTIQERTSNMAAFLAPELVRPNPLSTSLQSIVQRLPATLPSLPTFD